MLLKASPEIWEYLIGRILRHMYASSKKSMVTSSQVLFHIHMTISYSIYGELDCIIIYFHLLTIAAMHKNILKKTKIFNVKVKVNRLYTTANIKSLSKM